MDITALSSWKRLAQAANKPATLQQLFAENKQRSQEFSLSAAGLTLDYSNNHLNHDTVALLIKLAEDCQLPEKRQALFAAEPINYTENRPVLHPAYRCSNATAPKEILQQRQQLSRFINQLRQNQLTGYSGKTINTVINIGIGGSHLGPEMVVQALQPYDDAIKLHFIANIDSAEAQRCFSQIDAQRCLFVIASKTFTTQETLTNAHQAKTWLMQQGCPKEKLTQHFAAVTTADELAQDFGIDPLRIFSFAEGVGGRYSLWSSIGLPIAAAIGMNAFEQLLAGAEQMDQHFKQAPLSDNMPVLLALIGIWRQNFCGADSQAIIPYASDLNFLVPYLQQLEMESNGKQVNLDGKTIPYQTGSILWGGVGSNGQHAFHQLLHQGTRNIAIDFILPLKARVTDGDHALLIAHCLAQIEALKIGRAADDPHRALPGNHASNLLYFDQLTASRLGALIALYEHKVFVQSVIWQINAFDQWGVELGKQLANQFLPILQADSSGDQSNNPNQAVIDAYRVLRSS